MNSESNTLTLEARHRDPNLWIVATIFTILFLAGLYPVTMFGGMPYFPGPSDSASAITNFFQLRSSAVLLCAFFHFGAAIALGIFTATVVSQLRFLGARVAGTYIALFGGLATALNMMSSASVLWIMAHPGIVQDATRVQALYYLQYVFGGPGFSVPLGLLMAGVSIPSGLGVLKAAGALGLVIGIGVLSIGIAAAIGLVVYSIGAVVTVVRSGWYSHIAYPTIYLLLAVGSLALRLALS
jgi:hypothetical protein